MNSHLFLIAYTVMYEFERRTLWFPHPMEVDESGILCMGGDLNVERLILAYHYGIYPWYNPKDPILWWAPIPRYVIFPDKIKVSKSMRNYFNQNRFTVTYNQNFDEVIHQCRIIKRKGQRSTWITDLVIESYTELYRIGLITSVEVWNQNGQLAGGLYGINMGKVFFGESMFSLESNASKYGFITLAQRLQDEGYKVIDCQQPNPHLESLGGEFISGGHFYQMLFENRMLLLKENGLYENSQL